MASTWLPDDLLSVAYRLAAADMYAYEIFELISAWSYNHPIRMQNYWRDKQAKTYEARVVAVRPVPPLVMVHFSDGIHQVRAALDNVVWHLANQANGPLSARQAHLISMPIHTDATKYESWVQRRVGAGLTCFAATQTLGVRLQSLQPFADPTEGIASMGELLALISGMDRHVAHPLLLLQAYSNLDKHRKIAVSAARGFHAVFDMPFLDQDRRQHPVKVGDVLATGVWGQLTMLETSIAATIQRPHVTDTWVNPAKELSSLRRYVADIAIPILLKGVALPGSIPPKVDLSDSGQNDRERLHSAGGEDATARFAPKLSQVYSAAMAREPDWIGEPIDDASENP